MAGILIGNEEWSNQERFTQVFLATHDGKGNRLSHASRSFMSFCYDDKWIEDFGLIATINDRLSKSLYANFEDSTTEYDTLDGQYYWGSHYQTNGLEFTLSTDSMTQKQMEDFKHHFTPGKEAKLILAEHPNRWIFARVSAPPSMSMIPFEMEQFQMIGTNECTIKTTEYKGDITLSFVMDEPHWHGLLSYIPFFLDIDIDTMSTVTNSTNNSIYTLDNDDILKIAYEDHLPFPLSFAGTTDVNNIFLGDEYMLEKITDAVVGEAIVGYTRLGQYNIEQSTGFNFNTSDAEETPPYLFYSGTAPSYPTISFTMDIKGNDGIINNNYIVSPKNSYSYNGKDILEKEDYSYIKIGEQYFYFTTPGLFSAYNKAINILTSKESYDIVDFREIVRNEIKDKYIRSYIFEQMKDTSSSTITTSTILNKMPNFFTNDSQANFTINSKTGECKCTFTHIAALDGADITENVGDMVRSDYLILKDRNTIGNDWYVTANDCSAIEVSSGDPIKDFCIVFDNMYL